MGDIKPKERSLQAVKVTLGVCFKACSEFLWVQLGRVALKASRGRNLKEMRKADRKNKVSGKCCHTFSSEGRPRGQKSH